MKELKQKLNKSLKSLLIFLKKNNRLSFFLGIGISLFLLASFLFVFKNIFLVALVNNQPLSRISFQKELEKQYGSTVLENLILKALIFQEAKKNNLKITDKEIEERIKIISQEFESSGEKFDDFLKNQGKTRKDLASQIKIQLAVEKILSDQLQVNDQEVLEYFEKNKSQFPEEATLEKQKEEIREFLKQQKLSEAFENWLAKTKQEAKVLYFLQF